MHKYYVLVANGCYVTLQDSADRAFSKLLCEAYFWLSLDCAKAYAKRHGYTVLVVTMNLTAL